MRCGERLSLQWHSESRLPAQKELNDLYVRNPKCRRFPKPSQDFAKMRAIFNHALRWEWPDQNPISRVRQSEKRSRIPVVLIFTNWSAL
jgi:hypothetical protein